MKLSRAVINTIRFDTELSIIGNRPGVKTQIGCDGYCLDGIDINGHKVFAVGIRIKISFFVDNITNEAAGYLSETESTVLTHITPLEDMPMLKQFSIDVFTNIKRNLQFALPILDLTYLEFSDPIKMAYYLSDGLIQLGLYK